LDLDLRPAAHRDHEDHCNKAPPAEASLTADHPRYAHPERVAQAPRPRHSRSRERTTRCAIGLTA
ncbi:MAG: hypothetical protein QGG40_17765, partial [Myxococcota bacterium]|nr:hypothetical protein [Myxococcota bacterium]